MRPSPVSFGASLTVRPAATSLKDLDQDSLLDLATLADDKDQLNDRLEKIDDKKDPLSLTVDVSAKQTRGSISSRVNGSKSLTREEGQGLTDFIKNLISEAEEMAKSLISPEEKKQKAEQAMTNFLSSSGPVSAFTTGNVDFVRKAPGNWEHEINFHCQSSEGAIFEIGGKEYKVDKTVNYNGPSYEFQSLDDTGSTLKIDLTTQNQVSGFRYEDKLGTYYDLAQLQNSGKEEDKIKLHTYIVRTKNAIGTVESLGVFSK